MPWKVGDAITVCDPVAVVISELFLVGRPHGCDVPSRGCRSDASLPSGWPPAIRRREPRRARVLGRRRAQLAGTTGSPPRGRCRGRPPPRAATCARGRRSMPGPDRVPGRSRRRAARVSVRRPRAAIAAAPSLSGVGRFSHHSTHARYSRRSLRSNIAWPSSAWMPVSRSSSGRGIAGRHGDAHPEPARSPRDELDLVHREPEVVEAPDRARGSRAGRRVAGAARRSARSRAAPYRRRTPSADWTASSSSSAGPASAPRSARPNATFSTSTSRS